MNLVNHTKRLYMSKDSLKEISDSGCLVYIHMLILIIKVKANEIKYDLNKSLEIFKHAA